jgi:hypothetical protein
MVYRFVMGWTVRGSNPGGNEIFCTRPDGSGAHPASYIMGTGSFPGVNWQGRGVEHLSHPEPKLKKQ